MTPERAQAVVEARLGRPAQDRLEAAVVLEAWCGLQANEAIEQSRRVVRRNWRPQPNGHRAESLEKPRSGTAAGFSLLLAAIAMVAWASPLSAQLGSTAWLTAVRLALPATLALQGLIWSRRLGCANGLGALRRERPVPIIALLAMLAATLALGEGGLAGCLLISIWVGGTVLANRGWIGWYALVLGFVTAALRMDVPPLVTLGLAAVATVAPVTAATVRSAPSASSPGNWLRALGTPIVGAWLGLLIVSDNTIGWELHAALPALALIPSTVGGLWAARHLSRIHDELPRALERVPSWRADRISKRGPGITILAGSALRLVLATVALSLACVAAGPAISGTIPPSLFVGFGCLAIAALLAVLLVSLGLELWATFAVSVALLVEATMASPGALTQPGSGLVVGSMVAALLMTPVVLRRVLRPGRTLATAVWIP